MKKSFSRHSSSFPRGLRVHLRPQWQTPAHEARLPPLPEPCTWSSVMWSFTCSPGGQPPVYGLYRRGDRYSRGGRTFRPARSRWSRTSRRPASRALIRQNPEVRSRGRSQSVCRSSRLQRHRAPRRSGQALVDSAITVLGIIYGLIGRSSASGSASNTPAPLPTPGPAPLLEGVYLRVNGL